MPNQATIQSRIWRGYAKAAERLGAPFAFHRPSSGNFPGDLLFTRSVSLNAEDMKYGRPDKYGKATWYALVDGTGLQPGDYFIGAGAYFIAGMSPLLPILAVECNRTVTLERTKTSPGIGARPYSAIAYDQYAVDVPCSILQGTKGERNSANLPGDTRLPWWTVLLPAAVGSVGYGDAATDELGNKYIVSSAELTELGYRLTAALAVP